MSAATPSSHVTSETIFQVSVSRGQAHGWTDLTNLSRHLCRCAQACGSKAYLASALRPAYHRVESQTLVSRSWSLVCCPMDQPPCFLRRQTRARRSAFPTQMLDRHRALGFRSLTEAQSNLDRNDQALPSDTRRLASGGDRCGIRTFSLLSIRRSLAEAVTSDSAASVDASVCDASLPRSPAPSISRPRCRLDVRGAGHDRVTGLPILRKCCSSDALQSVADLQRSSYRTVVESVSYWPQQTQARASLRLAIATRRLAASGLPRNASDR